MRRVADRLSAARALGRVLRRGAWANIALRTEAEEPAAIPEVQSLVMGALRHVPWLDRQIAEAASRPVDRIEPQVLDILRVGAHELRSSDRPPAVIVDTTVAGVKLTTQRAAGFANAVMRKLSVTDAEPPELVDLGYADWLVQRIRGVLAEATLPFLEASQLAAPIGIRTSRVYSAAQQVPDISGAWLWPWTAGPVPPGAVIQDPASVAVGLAVDAEAGERVLDVAAAPGGKASHLIDQVGSSGTVVATEAHARRARTGRGRVPAAKWVVADGGAPPFAEQSFDRVLLDAPCTGLGTLRRRPEIRYRVTPDEVERLADLQRRLLEASLARVRDGGRLVYSVCTVTHDETVAVVQGLGGRPPDALPGTVVGDGLILGPHLGPTDGMFICVFDR